MASLIQSIYNTYNHIFYDLADRRSDNWFLIRSIWSSVTIVMVYMYFVKVWGPRYMKNRKPYKLNWLIPLYNTVQIVWCLKIFVEVSLLKWGTKYKFIGEPVNYSNDPEALYILGLMWQYYTLKLLDLMDTVFFVLRKKSNQVTFLHLYHHCNMIIFPWIAARYLGGGHAVIVSATNCLVHVFVYGYYFITNLWPEYRNTWWKKHITHIQLFQFVFLFFHALPILFMRNSNFPTAFVGICLIQNIAMIILFSNFYMKVYLRKNKE